MVFTKKEINNNQLTKHFWLSGRQPLFLLAIILLMSIFLRMYGLGRESLWHDEALTIDVSKNTIQQIISFSLFIDNHPPLHYIILHYWMQLFGDTEIATRFLSVIFGVIAIYVMYRVGEITFNKEVGIISSFILSISLYHIRYSQETRAYSLLVLLVLLSNFYFVKFLKEKDPKKINLSNKNLILYVIFTAMTAFTHVFGLFYIIAQNIYYLFTNKKNLKLWIVMQGIIFILFSPWLYIMIITKITITGANTYSIPIPDLKNIYGTFSLFSGNDFILYFFIFISIVGMAIFYKNKDKLKSGEIFVLIWIFVPIMISFIISLFSIPIFYDRYVIASLPAFLLLVAYTVFNFQKRSIIAILLIFIIFVSLPPIKGYYQTPEKEQWREAVNYIEEHKKPGDIILLYPQYGQYGFDYYYKNPKDVYMINGSYEIKNDIRKNSGIWFVNTEYWVKSVVDESKVVDRQLSKTHEKIDIPVKFIDVNVYYYKKLDQNVSILYLYQKDTKTWQIMNDGAWGILKYNIVGSDLQFSFEGHKLLPNTGYSLVYINESELQNNSWIYIAQDISGSNGDVSLKGYSVKNICDKSKEIRIRLILSNDYDQSQQKMAQWNTPEYLYEDDKITCEG